MAYFTHLFRSRFPPRDLLPSRNHDVGSSAMTAREVTRVALRLKYLVEQIIPTEIEKSTITASTDGIITKDVVKTALKAGGDEHQACVVYALLVCYRWFQVAASSEMWDSALYDLRVLACDVLAKRIVEEISDHDYLMMNVLLQRYSTFAEGRETPAMNAVERATDLHALNLIGSSGYQKCVKYLWYGWLCPDAEDPSRFMEYHDRVNTRYWAHFHPDRVRAPVYQNVLQIFLSVSYLILYTGAINTVNKSAHFDAIEVLLYLMTLGYILDELSKLWKVGLNYLSFWNTFSASLYSLIAVSFVFRLFALSYPSHTDPATRAHYNDLSYNFLAFSAPMFWGRLLLYLDTIKIFGAMIVVLSTMLKESLIFFSFLLVVMGGFLQAFVGMDQVSIPNEIDASIILQVMVNTLMGGPDFTIFATFAPPFGNLLYYIFAFIVVLIFLNILIALYNSAYTDIVENATSEYLAHFAQRTVQYVRAPDENVFIPPFNLIEIFCLIIPMEWWMSKRHYARVNDWVMLVIYSPLLLFVAGVESFFARKIQLNRRLGEEDDDELQEWEVMAEDVDYNTSGDMEWKQSVQKTRNFIEADETLAEVKDLKKQVAELSATVTALVNPGNNGGNQVQNIVRTGTVQPEGSLLDSAPPEFSGPSDPDEGQTNDG